MRITPATTPAEIALLVDQAANLCNRLASKDYHQPPSELYAKAYSRLLRRMDAHGRCVAARLPVTLPFEIQGEQEPEEEGEEWLEIVTVVYECDCPNCQVTLEIHALQGLSVGYWEMTCPNCQGTLYLEVPEEEGVKGEVGPDDSGVGQEPLWWKGPCPGCRKLFSIYAAETWEPEEGSVNCPHCQTKVVFLEEEDAAFWRAAKKVWGDQ